jgi:hypothetical protein
MVKNIFGDSEQENGSCRETWLTPGEVAYAGRSDSCREKWLTPKEVALFGNLSYTGRRV